MSSRQSASAKSLRPFTVDHFRAYSRNLVLDNRDYWEPQDFQLEVVEDLFALNPEVWLVVPEGNGKTTLMAGIALYHGDYTQDAMVVIGASSRDQCEVLHNQAGGFVRRTPGLKRRFRVFDGYRRITCLRTAGRIQVFAADDRTGDGVIPTLALLDELHRHRDLRLYRTWRGKLEKRNGQLAAISTGGEPDSEFEDIRERLKQGITKISANGCHVRAAGGGMVLHDWAVPTDGDCEDMKQVVQANPLHSITVERLEAKRASPTMSFSHWRRFVCNQAVRGNDSAIQEPEWDEAKSAEEIPEGEPVAVGIDFGWKWDTTALVPMYSPQPTERLLGPAEILVPPRDGTSLHPSEPQEAFDRINARNPVTMVVLDPNAGGEQFAAWLEDERGIHPDSIISHSQATGPMCLA